MTARVTSSEAQVLNIVRAAFNPDAASLNLELFVRKLTPPKALGPTAQRLLSDTLAKGLVSALATRGGWQQFGGKRLWERTTAPPLHFSGNIIALAQWMLAVPLADSYSGTSVKLLELPSPLTPAEDAFVAVLISSLSDTNCENALLAQLPIRRAPLTVLMHAGAMGRLGPLNPPAFDVVTYAPFIEGLSATLSASWLATEARKSTIVTPAELSSLGVAQLQTASLFLDALGKADRRELATFFVDAAVRWLEHPRTVADYAGNLSSTTSLRERSEARNHAGALMRIVGHLALWHAEHRNVRFIDDGYDKAQWLVREWNRLGEPGFAAAAKLVAALEAI